VIARLVTTFRPYGFVLTAPVFEHLDLPELLDQEVAEDMAYGMVGKTAIHPTQIGPIEQHYKVKPQDLAVAHAILDESSPAVFRMNDSMCEVATHRAWAERTVEQSRLFGAHQHDSPVPRALHAAASSTERES
jgi:citrate lyase beta subunit